MPDKPAARSQRSRPKPSKRTAERLFQIGDFWLGYEAGSDRVFYCWYDADAGRTRRKTTGLRSLEEAKLWLAQKVLAEPPKTPLHPDSVTIAAVRRFYFQYHINARRNGRDVVRDKNGPRRAFALLVVYMWQHLKKNGIEGAPKVGQFSLALQRGFMRFCRDKHNHSGKTISTYLSYVKAGFRFAATPRLITDARDREREARLLSEAPHVADSESEVSEVTGLARSKPREWIPTDPELAAMIDHLRSDTPVRNAELEPAFRYVIMALNTLARPEANTELSVSAQVKFEQGIIDMNPPGRPQNKKVRPLIRLTDNLRGWLHYWNLDRPIAYYGKPIKAVSNKTLRYAAKRAGVAEWRKFNRYTLRHYMATRIRRVDGIPVSREERATWMGHVDPNHRTTEAFYESFDPDYLENVRRAIDAVLLQLDTHAKRSLCAPGAVPGTRLTVIEQRKGKPPTEQSA